MITKLLLKYSILHKNRQLNPDGLTIDELLDRMYVTLFEEKGRSGELSRMTGIAKGLCRILS